jgi:O-antigen/teichoic acid export membrane protein
MGKNTRIKNSFLNSSSNVIIYVIQSILSFIVRTIFIRKLGAELLGLDSLLVNILTMLSIAELGFSTAISYGLYKPLAEHKINKINAYMSFYKKVYHTIGIIILVAGILLSLFLNKIIGNYSYEYLYLVYYLYLFNTVSLYFISYKDILLVADQKNYKIFKYNVFFNSLIYVLQFILLLFSKNYIIYISIIIICKLINRILINKYITNYYKKVDFNSKEKLTNEEIKIIKENVFGLFFYKIGDYIINCTDNIIISTVINIITVGVYTNYVSIISILKTIIRNIFNGATASFGNLSIQENKEAELNVFNIMIFIGFVIAGYVTIILSNVLNPFIKLWLGNYYVLPLVSTIIICINFYLACNQMPLDTIKEAKGFYTKDRYIPIIQALINIVVSIVLGIKIGLNGVLLGTTISYVLTVFWIKPYLLYKYIFDTNSKEYFLDQIKYILTIILCYLITYNLFKYINLSCNIIYIAIILVISTILYVIFISILYYRRNEYKFLINIINNIIKRK